MANMKGKIVLSRMAGEEILRLATLGVYGVTGLAPVSFAERVSHALSIPTAPRGVDMQILPDGTIEATIHVRLQYGLRVSEVARTIVSQVRYAFSSMTGISMERLSLNVVVWSIRIEHEND